MNSNNNEIFNYDYTHSTNNSTSNINCFLWDFFYCAVVSVDTSRDFGPIIRLVDEDNNLLCKGLFVFTLT